MSVEIDEDFAAAVREMLVEHVRAGELRPRLPRMATDHRAEAGSCRRGDRSRWRGSRSDWRALHSWEHRDH